MKENERRKRNKENKEDKGYITAMAMAIVTVTVNSRGVNGNLGRGSSRTAGGFWGGGGEL